MARWLPAGIYVVLGVLALAEALRGSEPDPVGLAVGGVVLLLGLGRPVIQARRISRRLRAYAKPGTTRLVFTDAEYAAEAPGRTVTLLWTTFKSVALVRGFWVLRIESEGKVAAMREKGLLAR